VKKTVPETPRFRLDRDNYSALRRQILERDNWRCQVCGSMSNLEVHHIRFRSHSGPDLEQNLLTLCASCHKLYHAPRKIWPKGAPYHNQS
jgi:5-methylcytosine-specific restriction endonuclease McrA